MKPYYRNDHGELYCGDCLSIMSALDGGCADMVLCDLPYGTTACKWDIPLDLRSMWLEYRRATKSNSAIVLFAQTPFDKVLGCSNLELLRYELIWQKTHPTGHLNAKKMPMKAHENILVFYDKLPIYNPQKTSGHARKTSVKRRDDTQIYGEQSFGELTYDSTDRYPISVLVFPSDKQRTALHPTQKPVALFEYLIRTYTNEGDTVLDNCAGSGTTAIAAQKSGRSWICIEKEEQYCEIIAQRVEEFDAKAKQSRFF